MPVRELEIFDANLTYASDLSGSATALSALVTGAVDLSDMHRAAVVQAVSALDHYIHEEVRVRMLQLASSEERRNWPAGFAKFRVQLDSVDRAIQSSKGGGTFTWLEDEIRSQHQYLSFQNPDRIADALRLVSDVPLWESVAGYLGIAPIKNRTAGSIAKTRLKLVVDRRNLIAHEADVDPTPPRTRRYPISQGDVENCIAIVGETVHAISAVI